MTSEYGTFTAVVVDDEPLPRAHLVHLLNEAGVGEVLEAGSGTECLQLFHSRLEALDWVFLDVQMPHMDGLALADALGSGHVDHPAPAIVFVTGFEDYAIQAFDRAAVDYLLKPVARDRLAVTLTRLAMHPEPSGQLAPAMDILRPTLQRLPIRLDYAVRLVDLAEIVGATAHDKRVDVITTEAVFPTYYTLNQLEQRLPQDRFIRVHDSWLVNIEQVLEIHNLGGQSYQLRLRTSDRLVPVSRRRLPLLNQRLGL